MLGTLHVPSEVNTVYHRDAGAAAARLAVRIMRGENPASIPFEPSRETKLVANMEAARAIGLRIPASVLARAQRVIGARPADGLVRGPAT